MNLSEENLAWLEISAKSMDMDTEAFANALIRTVREELGRPDGQNSFPEWFNRGKVLETKLAEEKEAITETRAAVEEAARTVRLYLLRIESRRASPLGAPTP